MPLACEIVPRNDLSAHECQALATSLADWCKAESARRKDVLVEIEGRAMADLKQGRVPRSLAVRMAEASGTELAQVEKHLGPRADSRGIEIRVHCDDRESVVRTLQQSFDTELVTELIVDGQTWDR